MRSMVEGARRRTTGMRSKTQTLKRARHLRRRMTPPETRLWVRLRERRPDRPNFRRQAPFGPYILDFYCPEAKLAVEVDGWIHLAGDNPGLDERRDAWLRAQGVTVHRLEAAEVMRDPDEAAEGVWMLAMDAAGRRG
ncbi:MAG TPA: endonuclease domain-containing protein [Caulobacteraceae bacterium]|nr:endonuclease domain-containing protein [Caulobacteraceae bacterium]